MKLISEMQRHHHDCGSLAVPPLGRDAPRFKDDPKIVDTQFEALVGGEWADSYDTGI